MTYEVLKSESKNAYFVFIKITRPVRSVLYYFPVEQTPVFIIYRLPCIIFKNKFIIPSEQQKRRPYDLGMILQIKIVDCDLF